MELLNKSVMVVDDEPSVLMSVAMMLESRGCEVHQANSGMEALEKLPSIAATLDCIILDFTMPKLNGLQVLQKIRETNVMVPAIICSGLPLDQPTDDCSARPEYVLTKPFRLQDLSDKILKLGRNSS